MKLNELSPDARAYAIDKAREWAVDHDWWDCEYDYWKEKLEDMGYSSPEIQFSGFWSQGDGASFTSDSLPPPTRERAPLVWDVWDRLKAACVLLDCTPPTADPTDYFGGSVKRYSHSYCHEDTVGAYWQVEGMWGMFENDEVRQLSEELERALSSYGEGLTEEVRSLCREIYASLQREYEYLTSDEQVAEMLEAGEYEFDEEGILT